jgi:hypothetical protein
LLGQPHEALELHKYLVGEIDPVNKNERTEIANNNLMINLEIFLEPSLE